MKVVTVVVLRERDGAAVEGQLTVREAVGVAADGAAKEGVAGDVVFEGTQAEGDFAEAAMDVGDADRGERGAELADRDFHATGVGERVELDRLSVDRSMLAAEREAGAARATEDQESCHQEGAVDQCFGGEHEVKLSGGRRGGKSKKRSGVCRHGELLVASAFAQRETGAG